MDRLRDAAVLTHLIDLLRTRGSWAGETHLQKAVYLAKELLDVPFEFGYMLYKHGPFSFELRDELSALVADDFIRLEPQAPPYGPRFVTTTQASQLQKTYSRTLTKWAPRLEFVASHLGGRGVKELEKLATAVFASHEFPNSSVSHRAKTLSEIKPHISIDEAKSAIHEADAILEEAREAFSQ